MINRKGLRDDPVQLKETRKRAQELLKMEKNLLARISAKYKVPGHTPTIPIPERALRS